MKFCCEKLEDNLDAFEREYNIATGKSDGDWTISTCSDHWYALEGVEYCPFCGTKLDELEKEEDEKWQKMKF